MNMFKAWRKERSTSVALSDSEKSKRIEELKHLIKNGDLKNEIETKDVIMKSCLHARDWDVQLSYNRIEKYTAFRKSYPDWVIHEHPKAYEHVLKKNITTMLDGRDKKGRRVYLVDIGKLGPDMLTIAELHILHNIWFEMVLYEPETIVNGVAIVFDSAGISWKTVKWFTSGMATVASKHAGLTPLQNITYHLINVSTLAYNFFNLCLPFCTQSVREKFHVHKSFNIFHEDIGTSVLPEIYGGPSGKVIEFDKIREQMYLFFCKHPKTQLRRLKNEHSMEKNMSEEKIR